MHTYLFNWNAFSEYIVRVLLCNYCFSELSLLVLNRFPESLDKKPDGSFNFRLV